MTTSKSKAMLARMIDRIGWVLYRDAARLTEWGSLIALTSWVYALQYHAEFLVRPVYSGFARFSPGTWELMFAVAALCQAIGIASSRRLTLMRILGWGSRRDCGR